MQIYRINNINDFLKDDRTYPTEVMGLKTIIENYISNFFAPVLNIKLDMILNILVQEEYKAIFFDELALLRPFARLLDIDLSVVHPEGLISYLAVHLDSKLSELKLIQKEEDLMVKFPTISGIYQTKKDHIAKSVSLEKNCLTIKPATQAELVKAKKLKEFNISRNEHASNLIEAYSFSLASFLSSYCVDIERILRYLDFLKNNVSQTMMPVSLTESLDESKINTYIGSLNTKPVEKGLK